MAHDPPIHVSVAYGLPERQWLRRLLLPAGSTVSAAIEHSGLRVELPDLHVNDHRVGIYGKPCTLATVLRDGDRVELYRALLCDPKEVRRQRAEAGTPADRRPGGRRPVQR
jgi:uncharacterized protein